MNHLRKYALSAASPSRRRWLEARSICRQNKHWSSTDAPTKQDVLPQFTIPKGIFGQPTCHTHPHLVTSTDHLTCAITQAEYKERRETLVQKLVAERTNPHSTHIIVIPAARKQYMSEKIPYVFRQNSDFFYLTGCLEPSAVLVIIKPPQTDNFKTILFVHDKDSHAELWEGPRTGCASSTKLFAVDEARPVEGFEQYLKKRVEVASKQYLFLSQQNCKKSEDIRTRHITFNKRTTSLSKPAVLWYHSNEPANPDLHSSIRTVLSDGTLTLGDPQRALHFMRAIKSPAEVELLKETCYIGSQAVNMAMACTKPGVTERAIEAVLEYGVKLGGAEHAAYPPVVAGGPRATHIHYVSNNQLLTADEMLLVDSGCQRWLYNSDISRTWPVSGKFSTHHRILYELVLAVQKRLIELLCDQRPSLDILFEHMCRLLGKHLQEEGILPKNIDGNELVSRAYRLCPHHVSHYLGLDVHDAPLVRRAAPVLPSMLVTVEPGIYIRPDDDTVPEEFRGVGIRIEDDVLITDSGVLVLTDSCVKEVADVEAIVGKHSI